MEPLKEKILRVLAEEIRTNTRLRREMGMSEGAESAMDKDSSEVYFTTDDGESFALRVDEL